MSISFTNMTTHPQDNNRNQTCASFILWFHSFAHFLAHQKWTFVIPWSVRLLSVVIYSLNGPIPKLCPMTLHTQLHFIQDGQQMFWLKILSNLPQNHWMEWSENGTKRPQLDGRLPKVLKIVPHMHPLPNMAAT